jgi:sporulation related protein
MLVVLALVLAACGRSDRSNNPAAHGVSASLNRGPDALVLRLPRGGGTARVYAYGKLDSLVWEASDQAPAFDRVLAFDDYSGSVAFVDGKNRPGLLDLRAGSVAMEGGKSRLSSIASVDGTTIYGVDPTGALLRLTPSGDWTFKPPRPARAVFPQHDGSVVLFASQGDSTVAWRLHPPEPKLLDTVVLPTVERTLRTQLGDRLYLASKDRLIGVRTSTLDPVPSIELDASIEAMVSTPSGDRLFVACDSSTDVSVVDRYRGRVVSKISLGARPDELRMDPLGRYLLVHRAKQDSAWVIAVATGKVVGVVATRWRADLPFVAPDGGIALVQRGDVVIVDGETLREQRRVQNGADDFWYPFLWSGFRPRAASLDTPAPAATTDTTDTTRAAPRPVDTSIAAPPPPPPRDTTATTKGFVVSFAALLNEQRAKELATTIHVRNETARVVTSQRDGTTIYRVVLGPFQTRDEAERIGRESGQSNWWVYEGAP